MVSALRVVTYPPTAPTRSCLSASRCRHCRPITWNPFRISSSKSRVGIDAVASRLTAGWWVRSSSSNGSHRFPDQNEMTRADLELRWRLVEELTACIGSKFRGTSAAVATNKKLPVSPTCQLLVSRCHFIRGQ